MNKRILVIIGMMAMSSSFNLYALGNQKIESFSKAKKELMKRVYFDHRETLYCGAKFDAKKNIEFPVGFSTTKYRNRMTKVEFEHTIPAENFGRTFVEWREGHPQCVSSKGKPFKGRKCAKKTNKEYRLMQADMYPLFPTIGSVNALRRDYNFAILPGESSDFGSCLMKVHKRKVEPPKESRGRIARSYLYFEDSYATYKMSKSQRQLMMAWDKQFPVSDFECLRGQRIKAIQGNVNRILESRCK